MSMKQTVTVLAMAVVASCAFADPADDVRCREIGFSRSAESRDVTAFRSFIDADARFVGASVLRGVPAIAEAWSVFLTPGGPAIKWRPQVVEVLADGRLALSRGPYRVVSEDAEGNAVESWGTFNSVWRLGDDQVWRVVFDAGSPAAEPPDEATMQILDAEVDCP